MRSFLWPISTAMVLAAASLAAAQEAVKSLVPRAGEPTVRYTAVRPAATAGPGADEAADRALVLSRLVGAPAGGASDPHREVILRLKAVATESCTQCHAGGVSVRKDEALGLTLVPADETLRAQLKLEKAGLVVTAVAKGSSGEASGIREKDIVVALAGKPLGDVESFAAALAEAGASAGPVVPLTGPAARPTVKPIALKLIRAGEPKELTVEPPGPPTLVVGRVGNPAATPAYWIGVSTGEVDDTLRSHLKLGDGAGLVVTDVLKGTPAEKAGLKKDDVLLDIDGAALKASDDIVNAVQATKGERTLRLQLRRAGEPIAISVRPEKRSMPADTALDARTREIRMTADVPQPSWVNQILPFIDGQGNQAVLFAPRPGPQGTYPIGNSYFPPTAWVAGQPDVVYPTANLAAAIEAEAQRKKAVEAEQKALREAIARDLQAQIQRINVRIPAETEWRAVLESLRKSARPAESLAKIDAQLKALEVQVGEIKRSMEELKGAVKKEK